ncbi:hypothetical protein CDL12_22304 [Handroanthus impetiginosus]|uniref:30S ribosomal protein S9 n=1 Tax=Handroanthus impetiginosus TaxID=429701 RepID=A0A2G9GIS7_9LAMI|nr:hypothetical protein CDL12_22304 [Handroanthus impetiginosus]
MLSRFIFKSSQFQRLVTPISSQTHIVKARPVYQNPLFSNPNHYIYPKTPHFSCFSNKGNNGNSSDDSATSTTDLWRLPSEVDQDIDLMFSVEPGSLEGFNDQNGEELKNDDDKTGDLFGGVDAKGWNSGDTGPNRAFGDLIAASGVTDEMLDSLIALKDFEGIQGLPLLPIIEDKRYDKNTKKQVDEKGRACGTGKRKCSIARVWTQPGEGKFVVNNKEFDVYFPVIDHRAASLAFLRNKDFGNVECQLYC